MCGVACLVWLVRLCCGCEVVALCMTIFAGGLVCLWWCVWHCGAELSLGQFAWGIVCMVVYVIGCVCSQKDPLKGLMKAFIACLGRCGWEWGSCVCPVGLPPR